MEETKTQDEEISHLLDQCFEKIDRNNFMSSVSNMVSEMRDKNENPPKNPEDNPIFQFQDMIGKFSKIIESEPVKDLVGNLFNGISSKSVGVKDDQQTFLVIPGNRKVDEHKCSPGKVSETFFSLIQTKTPKIVDCISLGIYNNKTCRIKACYNPNIHTKNRRASRIIGQKVGGNVIFYNECGSLNLGEFLQSENNMIHDE